MKFFATAVLLTLAGAASVELSKRASPLDVILEMAGNTGVRAKLTNTGDKNLKLFKTGSFLDTSSIEKVDVFSSDKKVPFGGVKLRVSTSALDEDAFQIIGAGETIEVDFDIGEVYDLATGGAFDIISSGEFSFADEDSTELAGAVPYTSNTIKAEIDGGAAAAVRRSFHEKRAAVQSDCTGSRRSATLTGLSNCRKLAQTALDAAKSGSASKFQEYFKSSSSSTRTKVANVFAKIVSECGNTTSGFSRYHCADVYDSCGSGVLAYTLPSSSLMVNCPLYFNGLSALTKSCHAQDQATTTLHEMTHLSEIKGTSDFGVYGYKAIRGLSATQNLNHADTYTLYANALFAGC